MGRWLKRLLGLIVVLGGVAAAGHFGGRAYVKDKVVAALDKLEQAGVEIEYDAIEFAGLVVPQSSTVKNINVYIPDMQLRFALPAAESKISLDKLDEFAFDLPDKVEIHITNDKGEQTGDVLEVSGADLAARLTAKSADIYDFSLSAGQAVLTPIANGQKIGAAVVVKEPTAAILVNLDRSQESLDATVSMEAQSIALQQGENTTLGGVTDIRSTMKIARGMTGVELKIGETRVSLPDAGDQPPFLISDMAFNFDVSAKDALNLSALLRAKDPVEAAQALTLSVSEAMLSGGAAGFKASVGSVKGFIPPIPFLTYEPGFARPKGAWVEGEKGALDIVAGPKKIGFTITLASWSSKDAVDGPLTFSAADGSFALTATAGSDGFDLAKFQQATAQPRPTMMLELIDEQLEKGGVVELLYRSGETSSVERMDNSDLRLKMEVDVKNAGFKVEGRIDAAAAGLLVDIDKSTYEWLINAPGAATKGRVDFDKALMSFTMPIAASDKAQKAPLVIDIKNLALNDDIWALVDPAGALPRNIDALVLKGDGELQIDASFFKDPFAFSETLALTGLNVTDLTINAIGLAAKGEAALKFDTTSGAREPIINGTATLELDGALKLIDNLSKTAISQEPGGAQGLAIMRRFLEVFAPSTDGTPAVKLAVEAKDSAWFVNSKEVTMAALEPAKPEPTEADADAATPAETDADAATPAETDANAATPTETDANAATPTETDANAATPTETDVKAVTPTETDANAATPTETDANAATPTEADANTTVPAEGGSD